MVVAAIEDSVLIFFCLKIRSKSDNICRQNRDEHVVPSSAHQDAAEEVFEREWFRDGLQQVASIWQLQPWLGRDVIRGQGKEEGKVKFEEDGRKKRKRRL